MSSSTNPYLYTQIRHLTKVRLKWVKSRGFDHIIERDTSIKACILIKDSILRSPSSLLSSRHLQPFQKPLNLTVPILRFLRRYPTLFHEAPHPRFPSLPSFSLTSIADILHSREISIYKDPAVKSSNIDVLAKILMMTKSRSLPVKTLYPLRYDLGLPDDFLKSIVAERKDMFETTRRKCDGAWCVSLVTWPEHLGISVLQRRYQDADANGEIRHGDYKRSIFSGKAPMAFPMAFPKGYGGMNKVKAWMEDFHRLPYISPYEDCSGIEPESDLMEKRVVGILHELLSLTVHKKTKRNYLRGLREEMSLPHRFTKIFTRYPGIFYLSLKCKTTTVMLREAYQRGKLINPHPLAKLRDKYYYVMRTGVLYRGKGLTKLVLDEADDDDVSRKDESGVEGEVDDDDEEDDEVEEGGEEEFYEVDDDSDSEEE